MVRNIYGAEKRADRDGRWWVWNHREAQTVGHYPTEVEARAAVRKLNAAHRRGQG